MISKSQSMVGGSRTQPVLASWLSRGFYPRTSRFHRRPKLLANLPIPMLHIAALSNFLPRQNIH
jgi:hypothetical protein